MVKWCNSEYSLNLLHARLDNLTNALSMSVRLRATFVCLEENSTGHLKGCHDNCAWLLLTKIVSSRSARRCLSGISVINMVSKCDSEMWLNKLRWPNLNAGTVDSWFWCEHAVSGIFWGHVTSERERENTSMWLCMCPHVCLWPLHNSCCIKGIKTISVHSAYSRESRQLSGGGPPTHVGGNPERQQKSHRRRSFWPIGCWLKVLCLYTTQSSRHSSLHERS